MLRNYFRIAVRNLLKQQIYTAINILGLAVSITACLLIVLYVRYESSYDNFVPDGDRIYKMGLERKYPNHATFYGAIPHSYAGAMQKDFPEVEHVMHLLGPNNGVQITYKSTDKDTKSFEEDNIYFADPSFLAFFPLKLLKGDAKTALSTLNQVLISQTAAEKYFGKADPLNKALNFFGQDFNVAGVYEDYPSNSHLKFDFMASFNGTQFRAQENYISFDSHTYLKLAPHTDASSLEAKFPKMVDTYASGQIERELGQSWDDYKKAGNGYRYFLQPLRSIHLDPTNIEFTPTPSGNRNYVYILSFIAILILVIACINFMNLATARSTSRAREVGLRKVMGSVRNQLIAQFLIEAILLASISTVLAVVSAYLLLPTFNTLIEKQLLFSINPFMILGLVAVALFVGIMAGLYPAFVLSAFNPVEVIKGSFARNPRSAWLRNGLVVFQFMISIFLIIATLLVGRQMNYMQNKNLGFDKSSLMMIERAFNLRDQYETFIKEVRLLPEVESVSGSSSRVGNRDDFFGQMFQPAGSNDVLTVKSMIMDDEFGQAIGFKLKEGRFFTKETSDSMNILLNETAVKTIGLTNPVGQRLTNSDLFRGDSARQKVRQFTIVGVISNFHFQSLRDEITPLVIFSKEVFGPRSNTGFVSIRIKPGEQEAAIGKVEAVWKKLAPQTFFRYEFLEDNLNKGYAQEKQSGKMFSVFSGLAIIIACVGLFGLSAYTASQRIREIGIRKVLGATVQSVVLLLSKDFTKLVLIAFVLASPIAWWMMDKWLDGFAYRIPVGIDTFLLAGLVAVTIALLTVSYQSIKAAIVNPVDSLRRE
jgi:putative ABC transport system permease protein